MIKLLMIVGLALACLVDAEARPEWLPEHFTIPTQTVSPGRRYGVMMPDYDGAGPSEIVEMKTGRVVATIAGAYGWEDPKHSMRWGEMKAVWSSDDSTLCWIYPDKWFPRSYVLLKLEEGRLVWQAELMKVAQREIRVRTEAAAPLNFAVAKLDNLGNGSAYPEGFSIDISGPGPGFALPLTCEVSLTSNPKGSNKEPDEDGVLSWLKLKVAGDGTVSFSDFRVKRGHLSQNATERVKTPTPSVPLLDTDLGKATLFPRSSLADGRYAVGWTVKPSRTGEAPVNWSHWDPTNPDKLLRLYDWQTYGSKDEPPAPYQAVDFVLDLRAGTTAELPTENPSWPWKRNGWNMKAASCVGSKGEHYGLVANDAEAFTHNLWVVSFGGKVEVNELTAAMRKAVNSILRERRPEAPNPNDYLVSYKMKEGEKSEHAGGLAEVAFVARAPDSDQKEFGLSGMVTIRLSDGTVAGASSASKRLDPFVTNNELRKADEELNTAYQSALKSAAPKKAEELKKEQRDWIAARDAAASQAVNIMPSDASEDVYEQAREDSLLESTKERVQKLKSRDAILGSRPKS